MVHVGEQSGHLDYMFEKNFNRSVNVLEVVNANKG